MKERLHYLFAAFLVGVFMLGMAVWLIFLPLLGIWWIAGRMLG